MQTLPRLWLDLTPDFRRRFQNLVFPEGIFYEKEKGFWNPKLSSIYKLSSDLAHENANKVDLESKEWLQIFREYLRMQNLAKEFIAGLDLPKSTYGYPLQGTNWNGMLGNNGAPRRFYLLQSPVITPYF